MAIRGWVYVLSNVAMPGIVKVGYNTKDPTFRVEELAGTGLPHPFVVEFDVLVFEPRDVEQAVHARLTPSHEAKEFYRVSVERAVDAIRAEVRESGKKIIAENFKSPVNGTTGKSDIGACPICGTGNGRFASRCVKCFAMI